MKTQSCGPPQATLKMSLACFFPYHLKELQLVAFRCEGLRELFVQLPSLEINQQLDELASSLLRCAIDQATSPPKCAPPQVEPRNGSGMIGYRTSIHFFRLLSVPAVNSLRSGESKRGPQCQSPRSCCWSDWANRRVLWRARTLTRQHSCSSLVRRDSQNGRQRPLRSSDWAVLPCPRSTPPVNRAIWK